MWNDEQYEQYVEHLKQKYPKMFSEQYGGIEVQSGWWIIIDVLCKRIQAYIVWKNNQNEFRGIDLVPQVVVTQIKEKFGELRFYYDGGDEYVHGLVTMAEVWASSTCEVCGKQGTLRTGGWLKTLCDEHHEERNNRKTLV
jgi:hypothetical protein